MNKLSKGTRITIIIMVILVIAGIITAKTYYQNINNAEDPRVIEAKVLYKKYNELTVQSDFDSIFFILDKILCIYNDVPHYKNSYETGVLFNNKAAAFLTKALYKSPDTLEKKMLLDTAKFFTEKAIGIYNNWKNDYSNLNQDNLYTRVLNDFYDLTDNYSDKECRNFIKKRIKDIEIAKKEIDRRLSVSYTNLGIINRHNEEFEAAVLNYKKAIDLWDHNYTAQDNLNLLLGRPIKKRSAIQKLFPPSKKL